MNQIQRKSAAKFLYDIAKILIAVAVIGNVFSKEALNVISVGMGIVGASLMFFFAYYLERRVSDE